MSIVDNCILSFDLSEDEEMIMTRINLFLNDLIGQSFMNVEDDSLPPGWYGGSKNLESLLFLAAFNYFREEEFLTFLKTLEWVNPENVQLIIQRQDKNKFEIIGIV